MKYNCLLACILTLFVHLFSPGTSLAVEVVLSNFYHSISYEDAGDTAIFTLEALTDTANNMNGQFPHADFSSILIDRNKNGKIDNGIDVLYTKSSSGPKLCSVFLINESSISECGKFPSSGTLKARFITTKNSKSRHPVYVYTLPKKELLLSPDSGVVNIFFEFHSAERGYTYYPNKTDATFHSAVSINLHH